MADRFVVQVERPHRKCHAPNPRAENCNFTNRFCRDQRLPGSFLGQASKTALVAAAASLAWTGDAWANCVLTPGTPTTLVCDDAGNNYPGGIEYLNFSTGLTAIVGAGVVIDRTPGDGNMGVNLSGNGNHTLALELAPGTIIRTNGFIAQGVQVHSTNNDNVVIVSGANVTTQGLDVAGPTDEITVGILGRASSSTGTGSVVVTQLAGSSIHVSGFKFVVGLHAQSLGLGDVFVESAGTVTAVGTDPDATYVSAISAAIGNPDSTGRMDVILHAGGAASTDAQLSPALIAENSGYGATNVIVDGTVEALGDLSDGVFAYSSNPNSTALTSVFLGGNGSITTHQLGYGIWSLAGGLGSSLVFVTGSIRTFGDEAFGVGLDVPSAINAASHQVVISGQGNIETSGSGSHGVRALLAGPGSLTLDLRDSARVTTSGDQAAGVYGKTLGDVLLVTASGTAVTASGSEAFGAQLDGGSDVLVLHAGSIAALGRFGVGLFAFSDASATVTLGAGASVMGGWQDTANGVGPNSAFPAAGVILGAAAASSLVNAGSIGAGSDRAVIDATRGGGTPAGNMTIANSGTITGFVELAAGGTNRFDNLAGGLFDIRHFADTDGDGVRDTKRVAISDFGDPLTSVFSNSGLTRLAPVSDAAATDPTGYYVPTTGFDSRPLEASYYSLNRNGVVQGQLVNLGEFDHSGILDLRGPAIGNSLVITSNAAAGGAPGSSVFVANGGQILLNAVLNDGIQPGGATNNYADMLIVDSTRLGSAPARIHVGIDPTLSGTLTTGNGIELVEVRDKTASAPGVFTLGSRVAAGAYEYLLYHNGVGADAADGNWYLRSTLIVSDQTGDPSEIPNYRPEVPVNMVVPALADSLGLAMLGTYHDRRGEPSTDPGLSAPAGPAACDDEARRFPRAEASADRAACTGRTYGWGRIFGERGAAGYGGNDLASRTARFYRHGPNYDSSQAGLQAGLDLLHREHADGARDNAGFYFGAGLMQSHVRGVYGGKAGSTDVSGYSLGAYWTRTGAFGWYLDAVLQGTWYADIKAKSLFGETLSTAGWGLAASLEGGQPISLGGGWALEPQAQLVYQHVSIDSGTDRFGLVAHEDTDLLHGRLGARLTRSWELEDGRHLTAWTRANLWHSFGGKVNTTFSSLAGLNAVSLPADVGGTWGQLQAGLSGRITDSISAFASGDVRFALGSARGHGYGGRVGMRVVW